MTGIFFRETSGHGVARKRGRGWLAPFLPALLLIVAGCGSGGVMAAPAPPPVAAPPPPGFALSATPGSLLVAQTSSAAPVTLNATATNSSPGSVFNGTITVSVAGLPAGVTTSPASSFSIAAGGTQVISFAVGPSVPRGNYPITFSGSSGLLSSSATVNLTVSGAPIAAATGNFKQQVIYQIVTDRFFDGDAANNDPAQSKGLFDASRTNYQMYWGGDFAGIQQKIAYLAGMGITAIWISPPADNINVGTPNAPFHGYWARDMKRIEEHFGDASNSWAAFDSMVAAAHANGIRVIVDFTPNHSNQNDIGEIGALYDAGTLVGKFNADPNLYFHHNPSISNFNDSYQLQYFTLFDLADLNQDNPTIDKYLKDSLRQFMGHGVDAFRIDAVKHANWGWEYSLANSAYSAGPSFVFGEWFQGGTGEALYFDSHKFANHSGMSLLDFPLANAMRDVFASNGDFHEIDNTITRENSDFASPNDLVTFVDNHDIPRLLSVNNNQNRLNEALVLLLACRGIPVVLYGDEQYLHNDTNGGTDPYNRIWMSQFDTQTRAYTLVNRMAALRQTNPALAYGGSQQRWINSDVYILERQFGASVALVAVNKSETANYSITGLFTALPAGSYPDYLNGLMGGLGITVGSGAGGNNPVPAFTLPAHTVAVWQLSPAASGPQIGSVGPLLGQAGIGVTASGQGFGSAAGKVLVGSAAAVVNSWSDSTITFTAPRVTPGRYSIQVVTSGGAMSNLAPFTVLTGPLVPTTFTVNNAPPTAAGEAVFLTGDVLELGAGATTRDAAVGPMLAPNPPTWLIDASVPAGATIQFRLVKIAADGTVTPENGAAHSFIVPSGGVGSVTVNWQY